MRNIKILLLALAIIPVALLKTATSEDPRARHTAIKAALARRDYTAAERELRAARNADKELFRANNYEYLLARVLEKRNNSQEAQQSYLNVINQNSILSEYARWHLAQMARRQKNLPQEREHIKKLLDAYPDSLLAARARERLAENYLESGDASSALQYYRARANRSNGAGREAMGQVGLAHLRLGQELQARAVFEQLIAGARDDQALLAAHKLDELDAKAGRAISETELLTRGRIYLHNRDSAAARRAYQQLVDRYPESRSRPEALYAIGRAYYIEYEYENAIRWYDRVHNESPASDQGEMGFYHAGHAYQNMGRHAEAVTRYQQVIQQYPNGDWLEGAHLNAIDTLRSAGNYDNAIDWCNRTMARFGRNTTASTALFNRAKLYMLKGDYNQALSDFTELRGYALNQRAAGATNHAEASFMRAYCLEKLGRYQEAIDAYLTFPINRDSYYGNRATLRLQALANDANTKALAAARFKTYLENARRELAAGAYDAAKSAANQALRLTTDAKAEAELLTILRQCYNNLPAYNRYSNLALEPAGRDLILDASRGASARSHRALADELIFLGLYDEGAPELGNNGALAELNDEEASQGDNVEQADIEAQSEIVDVADRRKRRVTSGSAASSGRSYSMAVYLNRGSHAHPALRYGESTFSSLPDDFRLELVPRDVAELLYPAPYRDEMSNEAKARGIDARFLLAIARQESRFQPDAKSAAAARGMFQFIASTADRISQELKLTGFNQNELYLPPVAIRFGAQYLADLFGEFKENPYAVAASYNGGEQAVRRWLQRARSNDIDRFVIEIAYYESKDYVYKVMNNYWAYCQLYREDLTPR